MSTNGTKNTMKIWVLAAIAGIIAFFALKMLADYSFGPAALLAILIAILVAILLWIGFYQDDGADGAVSGSTAAAGAAVAAGAAGVAASASSGSSDNGAAGSASAAGSEKETAQALMGDAGAAMVSEKKAAAGANGDAPMSKPKAATAKKSTVSKSTTAKKSTATKRAASSGKQTASASKAKASSGKTASKAPARKPVAKDGKPATLKKARSGGADDLKMIKGVGPGLEKTLNELGFYHYDQIAGWRKKEVQWVDDRLKFKGRIERDEWIKQAKVLAKGGTTEFSKRAKY